METVSLASGAFRLTDALVYRNRFRAGLSYNYMNGRRHNLLFYLLDGEVTYRPAGDGCFTLTPGSALFLPVASRYVSRMRTDTVGITVDFQLLGAGGEVLLPDLAANTPFPDTDGGLRALFLRLEEDYRRGGASLAVTGRLYLLFAALTEAHRARSAQGVLPAVERLENGGDADCSVPALARLCCLSESAFRRRFKEYTGGLTPSGYRMQARLRRAAALLCAEDCSVEDAAAACGFYDAAHFCSAFRRAMGVSPGHYRRARTENGPDNHA